MPRDHAEAARAILDGALLEAGDRIETLGPKPPPALVPVIAVGAAVDEVLRALWSWPADDRGRLIVALTHARLGDHGTVKVAGSVGYITLTDDEVRRVNDWLAADNLPTTTATTMERVANSHRRLTALNISPQSMYWIGIYVRDIIRARSDEPQV